MSKSILVANLGTKITFRCVALLCAIALSGGVLRGSERYSAKTGDRKPATCNLQPETAIDDRYRITYNYPTQ